MQSCLYDESPCKTLTYVLCQLRTVDSKTTPSMASVNVKVMYVQSNDYKCNFSSFSVRNITIFGYKRLFINFYQFGSLQISHSSSTAGLNWTWIELGFAWFGPQESCMKNPALYNTLECTEMLSKLTNENSYSSHGQLLMCRILLY